jgi:hypothetical protein
MRYWQVDNNDNLVIGFVRGDEAGYEIVVTPNNLESFHLFELPLYGGEPRPSGRFDNIKDAIAKAEGWT